MKDDLPRPPAIPVWIVTNPMLKQILLQKSSTAWFIQLLYGAMLRAVVFKRKATHDKVIREGELVRII